MKWLDEINYSLQNLIHRKLRSFLSILSILIGITAIFALISFGIGIQSYVNELAEEAGADKLFIQAKGVGAPGMDDTFALTSDDVDYVKKINGVDIMTPMYFKVVDVIHDEQTKYNFMMGVEDEHWDFVDDSFGGGVFKGRHVREGTLTEVMLGYNYQFEDKIFSKPVKLGDKLEIKGELFDVVGFYEEVGNPQDDGNIYTSFEVIEALYPESKDKFSLIMGSAEKDVEPNELADKITEKLRKHKDQEEGKEDFFVQTYADALATFQTVLNVINGILILIALVSIIVAAVNIMNTMYTAVIERTGEIGIMKAVGARNSDIMFIFVFEAGTLGMVGGLLGVILGYLIASAGGAAAAAAGYTSLQPAFPPILIIGCILFAFSIGAGAGILPARGASKLKPVDALRYE